MRAKIAMLLYLANRAEDIGDMMLSHKMTRRADRLIARMYAA